MSGKTNIWVRDASLVQDTGTGDIQRNRILAAAQEAGTEAVTNQREYVLKDISVLDIADIVASGMTDPFISGDSQRDVFVLGDVRGPLFVQIQPTEHSDRGGWRAAVRGRLAGKAAPAHGSTKAMQVCATGHRDAIADIFDLLDSKFSHHVHAQIKWWHQGDHGVAARTIYLEPLTTKLAPEFYPDMSAPNALLAEYMASDQSVLLIAGPPGTGKTTLLRHLICDFQLKAHVVYDEGIMSKDAVFQDFLFEDESDIMVIEDADTILTAREDSQNKLMARFLNVSDGLIKLPNKKLVFTTNISDFGRVDPALLRPGRCFDVLHTRALNLTEAQAAARVADVPIPVERQEYTLAELFNQERSRGRKVRKMGFK